MRASCSAFTSGSPMRRRASREPRWPIGRSRASCGRVPDDSLCARATLDRMAQLPFLEPARGVLADDERGPMTYEPGFVDSATAATWFAALRTGVNWRGLRRQMYEREVDVPRLIGDYWFDDPQNPPPTAIV